MKNDYFRTNGWPLGFYINQLEICVKCRLPSYYESCCWNIILENGFVVGVSLTWGVCNLDH